MATDHVQDGSNFIQLRRTRSRRFAIRAFQIIFLLHFYLGWRLLPDLPIDRGLQFLGGTGLVLSSLLIPFGTLSRVFFGNQKVIDRLTWAGALTMGWASSLLVFTIVRDVAMLVLDLWIWRQESAVVVLGLSIVVTIVGFYNARRVARVVRVTIPLDQLPASLEGFTIAQISDLHVGSTIRRDFVQAVVERANSLDPDAIALTGDIVDGSVAQLAEEVAPLANLRARHGVFLVTGNHEYYHGADDWIAAFRRLGLHPLLNAHVVLHHDGADLVFAGINDYSAKNSTHHHVSDPYAALDESPEGAPKILLAHQPRSAPEVEAAGFDLQLSGHTHGGQFWPWNYFVRLQQPYIAGLHRLGRMWVYTSRGTGYWGPPKRFGAPSEITLVTLSQAPMKGG
ncbi:MAG: metallophosphoesterase [Rhodospirillaceae bacterium]|nr:metallophosphoesterase [Rhodospirillaceae bacterium]